MAVFRMDHRENPVIALHNSLGDLSGVEIFNNQVLVAVYVRPEKTKGGILFTEGTRKEDEYQSKIGLVLKHGPVAFKDPEGQWFQGADIQLNDWVVFRPSDGWGLKINDVMCRVLTDTAVRGRVSTPDQVW